MVTEVGADIPDRALFLCAVCNSVAHICRGCANSIGSCH